MILIWGFRARYKTLEEATFACPHDGGDRPYRRRQARRWFTLFFIPIIPLQVLGEFIECASCGSTYDERVLTMPTAAEMMDNLANAVRQAAVALITADGVVEESEKESALAVVQRFADAPYTRDHLEDDLKNLWHGDLDAQLRRVAGILNEHGKESLLGACLEIAAADGSIDESELAAVQRAGVALGMTSAHVRGVISQARENSGA